MSSLKFSRRSVALQASAPKARRLAAALLRSASALLARLARRLAEQAPRRRVEVQLEYHADAGAPEGALYVDGRLVGYVDGVRRL